jgi:hypothetical protein
MPTWRKFVEHSPVHISAAIDSPPASARLKSITLLPCYSHHQLPDLCQGVVFECFHLDMGKIWYLVGRDYGIDDRRSSALSASLISASSSPGLLALNPCPPQARARAAKSGLGNSMPLWYGARPAASASKGYEAESRVVVDDNLHGQLVVHGGEEIAHEHIESTITAEGDYLA